MAQEMSRSSKDNMGHGTAASARWARPCRLLPWLKANALPGGTMEACACNTAPQEMTMTTHDIPPDFRPLDPGRIQSMDPIELRWWCQELHCDEVLLVRAISAVGEHVTAIRIWLQAHR